MKLLDKLKDLFTDEEEEIETKEIEIEDEKEPAKLPTFMRNKIEEEEKKDINKEREPEEKDIISDREVVKTRSNNFSFPIDMEEDYNIMYHNRTNKNVLSLNEEQKQKNSFADIYAKKEEPKSNKFKPTPVISPVYGVLDKNYTKDEVKVQDASDYEIPRGSKKIDFETVRNKAYGTLTDEIRNNLCENCELYKEVKITKAREQKIINDDFNLLEDITEDKPKEDVSIGEAAENYYDFGVDYEPPKVNPSVINAEKVEIEVNNDIKIVNHNGEDSRAEKIEVKEEPLEIPEIKEETPKRRRKIADKVNEEDKSLENTKEFEKITHDEESIDEILNDESADKSDEIPIDSEANDIFNLIDSMYDDEEENK